MSSDPRGRGGPGHRPAGGRPPLRAAAHAALGAAVLLAPLTAAAGCTFTNPQTTRESYNPGAGLAVRLSPTVAVSSLLFVAAEPGAPGALVVRVTNSAGQEQQVTLTAEGLDETFTVPARSTLALGGVAPGSEPLVVDPVPAGPGLNTPMTLTLDDGSTAEVQAPVLSSAWEEYQAYREVIDAAALGG